MPRIEENDMIQQYNISQFTGLFYNMSSFDNKEMIKIFNSFTVRQQIL